MFEAHFGFSYPRLNEKAKVQHYRNGDARMNGEVYINPD